MGESPQLFRANLKGWMRGRRMRNVVRISCLFLLVTCSFAGQTDAWKQYKNADGNFRVLFPGEPQDSVNKAGPGLQSHTLMAQQNPAFYTVVYTIMENEQSVDNDTFEVFKSSVFKELPKCTVGQDKPASPLVEGYIGHFYQLNCALQNVQLTMRGNLYWGKHHAYAVMAMFPAGVTEPGEVKTFMESFSLIDPAK